MHYVSELSEECFDFVVADFGGESTDEDFAMTSLRLFRIDFLVVDDVLGDSCDFIDGFSGAVYDECEATGAASLWIGFHIYAFNITVLSEMFAQFLCKWKKISFISHCLTASSRIGTHFLWFPNLVHQRIIFWKYEKNGVKIGFYVPCGVTIYKNVV